MFEGYFDKRLKWDSLAVFLVASSTFSQHQRNRSAVLYYFEPESDSERETLAKIPGRIQTVCSFNSREFTLCVGQRPPFTTITMPYVSR